MEKKNRSFGLDIVRFFAIVLVMINHSGPFLPEFKSKWHIEFFCGFLGVELFFCLSGFLIGTILIRVVNDHTVGRKDIVSFWVKRWFRTIPVYWFCLLLYAFCYLVFKYPEFGQVRFPIFLRYFVFIQNLFYYHPPFFEVSWSLCIEEWFYLIFPVTLFLLLKLKFPRKEALLVTIGIIILAAFSVRIGMYYRLTHTGSGQYSWDLGLRKIVIFRLDATVYGVLLAYVNFYYRQALQNYKRLLTIVGGLFFLSGCAFFVIYAESNKFNLYSVVLLFPLVNLGFSMLLINFFNIQKSTRYKKLSDLVEKISLISYSVYLLHFTIWAILLHFFSPSMHPLLKISIFVFFWVFTYFVASLSYTYIEKPVLRLRDRITAD